MTASQSLTELGYAVLPGFLSVDRVRDLTAAIESLYDAEGSRAGSEFRQEPHCRRLANLVDKGAIFRKLIADPEVLCLVGEVLGPELKLSSLNARSADPLSDSAQPLHADMGAIADDRGFWVCNTVWMLDEFTEHNGALRVVPGTHWLRQLPDGGMPVGSGEVLLTAPAGTVVVMNAHLWHGGTANGTDAPRRAIHGFYCRADKPQQQYQKALLRAETIAELSAVERKMLAIDDAENDRLSGDPNRVVSGFLKKS